MERILRYETSVLSVTSVAENPIQTEPYYLIFPECSYCDLVVVHCLTELDDKVIRLVYWKFDTTEVRTRNKVKLFGVMRMSVHYSRTGFYMGLLL